MHSCLSIHFKYTHIYDVCVDMCVCMCKQVVILKRHVYDEIRLSPNQVLQKEIFIFIFQNFQHKISYHIPCDTIIITA